MQVPTSTSQRSHRHYHRGRMLPLFLLLTEVERLLLDTMLDGNVSVCCLCCLLFNVVLFTALHFPTRTVVNNAVFGIIILSNPSIIPLLSTKQGTIATNSPTPPTSTSPNTTASTMHSSNQTLTPTSLVLTNGRILNSYGDRTTTTRKNK